MKKNLISELSFNFAIDIIGLHQKLVEKKEFTLSKQVLRAGTSIGANIEEATAAQSRKDFIAKMCIASKEARETRYWLKLFQYTRFAGIDYSPYLQKIESIINVLTKIIKTLQYNNESVDFQNPKSKI